MFVPLIGSLIASSCANAIYRSLEKSNPKNKLFSINLLYARMFKILKLDGLLQPQWFGMPKSDGLWEVAKVR